MVRQRLSSRLGLLSCAVCAPCPGASSCVPLVVGGQVIGSVLLSRPTPFDEADDNQFAWAREVSHDVQWAHAIAPGASIVLVAAASGSDDDLLGEMLESALRDTRQAGA